MEGDWMMDCFYCIWLYISHIRLLTNNWEDANGLKIRQTP